VYSAELAGFDQIGNMRLRQPQPLGSLAQPHPIFGRGTAGETLAHFGGEHDAPRRARGKLLTGQHAFAQPAVHGAHGHPQLAGRLIGCEGTLGGILGQGLGTLGDAMLAAQ